jgi:cobalamin biosynthesis protein CobT
LKGRRQQLNEKVKPQRHDTGRPSGLVGLKKRIAGRAAVIPENCQSDSDNDNENDDENNEIDDENNQDDDNEEDNEDDDDDDDDDDDEDDNNNNNNDSTNTVGVTDSKAANALALLKSRMRVSSPSTLSLRPDEDSQLQMQPVTGRQSRMSLRETFNFALKFAQKKKPIEELQNSKKVRIAANFEDEIIRIPGCHGNSVFRFEVFDGE